MLFNCFTHWSRSFALIPVALFLVSCGTGDGPDSVSDSSSDQSSQELRLVFEDDFGGANGSPRLAGKAALEVGNWKVETGYGDNGWGNDEWQLYQNSTDNLYTEDGNLVISAQCDVANCGKRDGTITSARINTKDRLHVKYGNIQARIKMPSGIGAWPAFWMLGADFPGLAWPDAGEIDIVEMHYFFSDNRTTHFTTHWGGPRYTDANRPSCSSGVLGTKPNEEQNCQSVFKTFDEPLTDDFHVFELDWTEGSITGKIDGITYFTQAIDPGTMEEFQKEFFLILNVAIGGTLGGPGGPAASFDWNDPNQTNMLVDWVRVFERVEPDTAGLISEDGSNLSYDRIINSAEFGGNQAITDLASTTVAALEGDTVMEVDYSDTKSGTPGGTDGLFAGAWFDFNRADLSDFTHFVFGIDTTQVVDSEGNENFGDITIEVTDSRNTGGALGKASLMVSAYTPTSSANWDVYEIPLRDLVGVNLNDVNLFGFVNPITTTNDKVNGSIYFDDLRFIRRECNDTPTVEFDSVDYNPSTTVGSVIVNDACAPSSLATVTVESGTDEIVVGVQLDASGRGEGFFGLLDPTSICPVDDSRSIIPLTAPMLATYTRNYLDANGTPQFVMADATAGVDAGAPGTTIEGDALYIYSSDNNANPLSFTADTDYFFSDFSSGSQFDGNVTTDSTFSPVFSVSDLAGEQAILALFGFTDGFTSNTQSINFKVKNLPGDVIEVKFGQDSGPETAFNVNLTTYSGSTALGDGWYEVSVPMTEFPDVGVYDYIVFASNNSSSANFTYLITDIFLREQVGGIPAECRTLITPPVTGSGNGATGATGGPFSISFDDSMVTYGFTGFGSPDTITATGADPLESTNMVAVTTKPLGAQVWAGVTVNTAPGITFPLNTTDSQITMRIYSPGAGLVVRMKLEDAADNTKSVETEATATVDIGWETLTFDFNNEATGTAALNPAFTFDKLSVFFGFGTEGDGTAYTWDTIEFVSGGTATAGEVPEVVVIAADGSTPDLAPGVDFTEFTQFGSGASANTAFAGDSSYANAVEVTIGAGYGGGAMAQFSASGFAAGFAGTYDELLFKVKGLTADNTILVKVEPAASTTVTVDLSASSGTGYTVTDLGDGWSQVVVQVSAFGDVASSTQFLFQTLDGAYAEGALFYLTDIGFNNAGGTATVGEVPEVVVIAADGSTPDLAPGVDFTEFTQFGSGASANTAFAGDSSYANAVEVTIGAGYGGGAMAQFSASGFAAGFAGSYDELLFKVKGLTADNTILVKVEPAASTTVTVDLSAASGTGYTVTDLGDGWSQVVVQVSAFGDVASSTQFLFQTLDGAYAEGALFYLTDIGFNNAGGTATVGEVPEVVVIAADGSTPDLAPGVDFTEFTQFGSGASANTAFAGDSSYANAVEVTIGAGYGGGAMAQFSASGFAAGFAGSYDELLFKVKGLTADNTILVKVEPAASTTVTVDLSASSGTGYTVTDLGDGWSQVVVQVSAFGDVASSTQFLFQTLDGAYAEGALFYLTDIGFNNAGGGGGPGGTPGTFENGDFETGDFTGWTQTPDAGTNATPGTISIVAPPGGQAGTAVARLQAAGDAIAGTQDVLIGQVALDAGSISQGDTIDVSFDLYGSLTGAGGVVFVELIYLDSGSNEVGRNFIDAAAPYFPSTTWTTYAGSKPAGLTTGGPTVSVDGGVTLEIKASCGPIDGCGVDAYIDNVTYTVTP